MTASQTTASRTTAAPATVLVTGASGFIGASLTRRLAASGAQVVVLAHPQDPLTRLADLLPQLTVQRVDLLDLAALAANVAQTRPDLCYHLAWYVEPGAYLTSRRNLDFVAASWQLAMALMNAGCQRLVGVGTCFEYDTEQGYLTEDSPERPTTLYAAAKLAARHLLGQLTAESGMSFVWARLFYQYGPAEDPRRLVAYLVQTLLAGRPVPLTPGEQVRDYLYLEDVAAALEAVGASALTGVINIGSGVPVTVRQLAETLGDLLGRRDLLQFGAKPYAHGDPMFVCSQPQRLRHELSWTPAWSLSQGLEATVAWFRDQAQKRGSA
jgi:nucleoside-diphosphate-sugar epimerase